MMARGFLPSTPFPGVEKPWPGVCLKCGQPSSPVLKRVNKGHEPCGYCSRRKIDSAVAEGKMLARDFQPSTPFPNAENPWPGVCLVCGMPGSPRLDGVTHGQGACLYCARNAIDPAVAEGKMLAQDFQPSVSYPGAAYPWIGVCLACGMHGSPRLSAVISGQGACRFCARQAVDLAVAFGTMMARNIEPTAPFPGTARAAWPGQCIGCGSQTVTSYASARKGSGCSSCAKFGFDGNRPGIVYIVTDGDVVKVGITGVRKSARLARMRAHALQGLTTVVAVRVYEVGWHAAEKERQMKVRVLRDSHLRVTRDRLRYGHTEATHVVPGLLGELMDILAAD